jgi:hypothetical protein
MQVPIASLTPRVLQVGLKYFVVSRTTGLCRLKFAKLSASAGDFLT